jgi:hypothetical protein
MLMTREDDILQELDPDIQELARRWSRDRPSESEDLAQEARLAICQQLRENPYSSRKHLFRRAKHQILDYRKRGRSIDSKLNRSYKRGLTWEVVSLDFWPVDIIDTLAGRYSASQELLPAEDLAIPRVLYSELRAQLTDTENRYLALRLQGYTCRETNTLLGLTAYQGVKVRQSIRLRARYLLHHEGKG